MPSIIYQFDSNQFLPTCLWIPSWDHSSGSRKVCIWGTRERWRDCRNIPWGIHWGHGIMMIYFQDLLCSVMVLILLEMPATEVPKDKSTPSILWWDRGNKHNLEAQAMPTHYKEKRIHSEGGQTLKPTEFMAFPSFSAFKVHKPWICFG